MATAKQATVGYTSTITTMILLIGVVIYHVAPLTKKNERSQQQPSPDQPTKMVVTHSIIEIPKALHDSQTSEFELDTIRDSTNHQLASI